jgi:signal transduction histidine kinase/CheY-like chemotaxis protein
MTRFRDRPIRTKLLLTTLASSATAVLFASGGFLAWDFVQFRSAIVSDMRAQTLLLADSSKGALSFKDNPVARETLDVLERRPQVEVACLYDGKDGTLFEAYRRDPRLPCPLQPPTAAVSAWDHFEFLEPVVLNKEQIGVLYIRRGMEDVIDRVTVGLWIVFGLLVFAVGAAFLVAGRMQRSFATPLLNLANTARTVSSTRDYSLRAVAIARDEVGVVVHAFNDMLDRIGERTVALSRTNAELEREIEERRRVEGERTAALERERDANRLKDEFLATLSHELRTPLNAVLGWTRVLRASRVDAPTRDRALESIERNARVQARLIEDLLEVSRIVTGKLRLDVEEVDLAAILESALEVLLPAAAAKRIRLAADIRVKPAMTSGDPNRLQQVIWNLLSNAVKFTPPDGEVNVRLDRRDGYVLTVQDNGAGIDPKFLPHVFDAFRQADGTSSREHGGLGLGLAIAKQLVELHGGTITARSAGHNTGATFEITLPSVLMASFPRQPRDQITAALPADHVDPAMLTAVRVLVVDDEADARELLETALRQYGAEVATAANVRDALAEIDRQTPDVLVSDIGMPNEDGFSLIRRLRARVGAVSSIPAVAITAYASPRDRSATEAAGFQAHVAKPFEPAEVARLVARLWRP